MKPSHKSEKTKGNNGLRREISREIKILPQFEILERHESKTKTFWLGREEIQRTFVLRDKLTGDIEFRKVWIPYSGNLNSMVKNEKEQTKK